MNEPKQSMLPVEIVFCAGSCQQKIDILVANNTNVLAAIKHSGILSKVTGLQVDEHNVGIFGKQCQLTDLVSAGDRIEIYRQLMQDPKDRRRRHAKLQGVKHA